MIDAPEAQKSIHNFQKFCNSAELTYAYDRGDEHVEVALIKPSLGHAGFLEVVTTNKISEQSTTRTYSMEEVRMFREFFNRPEITRGIEK